MDTKTIRDAAPPSLLRIVRRVRSLVSSWRLPPHLRAVEQTPGSINLEHAELLYGLAHDVKEGCILEVGSYQGRSTVALAMGAASGAGAPVYAIEPHEPFHALLGSTFGPEDRGEFFRAMLRTNCYRNVRLVNLSSEIVSVGWDKPIALLWIDGDHSYEGVLRDFQCWRPYLSASSHIVFDDALPEDGLGPAQLVSYLVDRGEGQVVERVGRVAVMRILV